MKAPTKALVFLGLRVGHRQMQEKWKVYVWMKSNLPLLAFKTILSVLNFRNVLCNQIFLIEKNDGKQCQKLR